MTDEFPDRGRVAGIDYGTVRIGIALSDADRTIASPFENYTRSGPDVDERRFQKLVAEETVVGFVVGLPVHMSGDESAKSREARQFGEWLVRVTGRPVCYQDERLTSAAAEELLLGADLTAKQRKKRRDMLAAQIILQTFLDSGGDTKIRPL